MVALDFFILGLFIFFGIIGVRRAHKILKKEREEHSEHDDNFKEMLKGQRNLVK